MPHPRTSLAALAAALAAIPALALAQAVTLSGAITTTEHDRIVVRTADGDKVVLVGPGTKVRETEGAGVLRRESRSTHDLVRGLHVEIIASPAAEGHEYSASSITYKKGSMKTARAIDAGLHEERERIAESERRVAESEKRIADAEKRLDNVGELEAHGRTKVFFDTGSSALSEQAKHDLQAIAAKAKDIKGGFRLAVVGRADPRGNAAANQRLSEKRADAVSTYLLHQAGIRPGMILPQTAIGASHVADDPDPPASLAEGRRVTVTVLVSKANTGVARPGTPK
jgi:outer membrane protein OmpA-like peptidoglycan-associated protein